MPPLRRLPPKQCAVKGGSILGKIKSKRKIPSMPALHSHQEQKYF